MGARNEALGAALAEVLDVEVPDTLVTNQAREKYALMMTDMKNNGMEDEEIKKMISPENFVKYKDLYTEVSADGVSVLLYKSCVVQVTHRDISCRVLYEISRSPWPWTKSLDWKTFKYPLTRLRNRSKVLRTKPPKLDKLMNLMMSKFERR